MKQPTHRQFLNFFNEFFPIFRLGWEPVAPIDWLYHINLYSEFGISPNNQICVENSYMNLDFDAARPLVSCRYTLWNMLDIENYRAFIFGMFKTGEIEIVLLKKHYRSKAAWIFYPEDDIYPIAIKLLKKYGIN